MVSPVAEIEAYEELADPMAAAPPAGHETRVVFLRPTPNGWSVVADWAHAAAYHREGKVPVGVLRVEVQDIRDTARQLLFVDHAEWVLFEASSGLLVGLDLVVVPVPWQTWAAWLRRNDRQRLLAF